jgi:hypothetical protein
MTLGGGGERLAAREQAADAVAKHCKRAIEDQSKISARNSLHNNGGDRANGPATTASVNFISSPTSFPFVDTFEWAAGGGGCRPVDPRRRRLARVRPEVSGRRSRVARRRPATLQLCNSQQRSNLLLSYKVLSTAAADRSSLARRRIGGAEMQKVARDTTINIIARRRRPTTKSARRRPPAAASRNAQRDPR